MLAGAIIVNLVTLVARMQRTPIPTVGMIDEFAALAAGQVKAVGRPGPADGANATWSTT